jgi:hypothetical protein
MPPTQTASSFIPTSPINYPMRRIQIALGLTFFGFLVFLIGVRPDVFGLDRSPILGFVQIGVFVVGLGSMCVGGYICLFSLWKNQHISITAEIGQRLVATGYLVVVFAGLADIFGFGSHLPPNLPYFGIWQQTGVLFGQIIIAIGFLMLIPYRRQR